MLFKIRPDIDLSKNHITFLEIICKTLREDLDEYELDSLWITEKNYLFKFIDKEPINVLLSRDLLNDIYIDFSKLISKTNATYKDIVKSISIAITKNGVNIPNKRKN